MSLYSSGKYHIYVRVHLLNRKIQHNDRFLLKEILYSYFQENPQKKLFFKNEVN